MQASLFSNDCDGDVAVIKNAFHLLVDVTFDGAIVNHTFGKTIDKPAASDFRVYYALHETTRRTGWE